MAAELPKWLVSARGVSTASKTEEQKEKAKTKNQKRYEARKRRVNRKREAKLAKLLMGMEEQINKVQVDMRELIDAEKERSQRFLSLARKYYGMWKTLSEKCQGKSVWKSPRSQMQYSTSNVSSCFALIKTRTNPGRQRISVIFGKSDRAVKVKCNLLYRRSTIDSLHKIKIQRT